MDHRLKAFLENSATQFLSTSEVFEPSSPHLQNKFTQTIDLLNKLGEIAQGSLIDTAEQIQIKRTQAPQQPPAQTSTKPTSDKVLIEALLKLRKSSQSSMTPQSSRSSIIRTKR